MSLKKKKGEKKPHFVSEVRILRQYGEVYLSLATSSTLWALTGQIYEYFYKSKPFSQVFNNCHLPALTQLNSLSYKRHY